MSDAAVCALIAALMVGPAAAVAYVRLVLRNDRRRLIGLWHGSMLDPHGRAVTAEFQLQRNGRFTASCRSHNVLLLRCSGKWEYQNSQLIWRYEDSNPPLPESLRMDVDTITSVSATHLCGSSTRTGRHFRYTRQSG